MNLPNKIVQSLSLLDDQTVDSNTFLNLICRLTVADTLKICVLNIECPADQPGDIGYLYI